MNKTINVTAAIIEKNGKVLAARRKAGLHLAGYWEFPGGKLEAGETPEECLERELQEEFRISTKIGLFVGESIFNYSTKTVRLMAYKVEHISGDFELIDHDEIRWLSIDELDSLEWAPADVPLVEKYKAQISTASYYQNNAKEYCDETYSFNTEHLYKPFLNLLADDAHILDLGCGSGRDSEYFIKAGYKITAMDGCTEVAAYAEQVIGQPVAVSTFQEIEYDNEFDGIWASASLLHCPKEQIVDVLQRINKALQPEGIAYLSFKWGEDDTEDNKGRSFNNYTLDSLKNLLMETPNFSIVEVWESTTPLRGSEQKWVNALVKRDVQVAKTENFRCTKICR